MCSVVLCCVVCVFSVFFFCVHVCVLCARVCFLCACVCVFCVHVCFLCACVFFVCMCVFCVHMFSLSLSLSLSVFVINAYLTQCHALKTLDTDFSGTISLEELLEFIADGATPEEVEMLMQVCGCVCMCVHVCVCVCVYMCRCADVCMSVWKIDQMF